MKNLTKFIAFISLLVGISVLLTTYSENNYNLQKHKLKIDTDDF